MTKEYKYDLPDGWTCIACGNSYPNDIRGKYVADYTEGTMCNECHKEESENASN